MSEAKKIKLCSIEKSSLQRNGNKRNEFSVLMQKRKNLIGCKKSQLSHHPPISFLSLFHSICLIVHCVPIFSIFYIALPSSYVLWTYFFLFLLSFTSPLYSFSVCLSLSSLFLCLFLLFFV